jgi:hypothetical protein
MSRPREIPQSVLAAVWVMLIRSGVSVIAVVTLLAMRGDLKRRYLEANPDASESDAKTALTIAVVTAVVILVFYVVLAFHVRNGRNWARITTWAIAGVGFLGTVLSLGEPELPVSRGFGVTLALMDLAVVVLLATGESGAYFRAQT